MLEIVFGTNAYNSLLIAQNYGKGKYYAGAVSVIINNADGSPPTTEQIHAAQIKAEERSRMEWEHAIPLGGNREDVYCFDLALSVGDISDNGLGEQRKALLKSMLSICPLGDFEQQTEDIIRKANNALSSVIERYIKGEEVRIWYSHNPDELCGMYWLMAQLRPANCQTPVYLVKLPTWEYGDDNTVISRIGWGEIGPSEWGKYVVRQEQAHPAFISSCAIIWRNLQGENSPLRVMLNGKIQSMPADIYDSFILREIAAQPEQFKMAVVIGNVLGKYQLGIGDAWVASRIDTMIENGLLEIVQDTPKGEVSYRRILRKCRESL